LIAIPDSQTHSVLHCKKISLEVVLHSILDAASAAADDPEMESRLKENAVTMTKMTDLRAQMENLNMLKKQKVT
jgi:hypothetical protein